jgi:hypothetical protein
MLRPLTEFILELEFMLGDDSEAETGIAETPNDPKYGEQQTAGVVEKELSAVET